MTDAFRKPPHVQCGTCMAYEPDYAQCRRGAPGTSAAGRALWPVVQGFEWCLAYLPDLPTQTLLQAEGTGGRQ